MRRTQFRFPVTTLAGSSLSNIRAIHREHHLDPKYRGKFLLTKIVAGIFEVFNLAERIVWQKKINAYKPEHPPVFIIGFWRSGTTLLHNLLCKDPDAAYTTTLQTVFPNLVLTQSWWLKPVINFFLPAKRPYDNVKMDMDYPQEEDFGLMNLQPLTIYKFFIYPSEFDAIVDENLFTGQQAPEKVAKWKQAYRNMIAKAVINTGGKRYIGKNPCHITRLELLLEMYPDAKFIFIHRHPHKVCESLYHFILSIFPGVQLQDVPESYKRETIVLLYKRIMETYLADRYKIPAENLVELRMDDFLDDIPGNLRSIYEKLDLGDYSKVASLFDKHIDDNASPHRLPHPPEPETIELIRRHCGDIMKQLGYEA